MRDSDAHMNIGKRIYYDAVSGDIVLDTGERGGDVVNTTPDQDFKTYPDLMSRDRATVRYIELEYGSYTKEFGECEGYRIDPDTCIIEFF